MSNKIIDCLQTIESIVLLYLNFLSTYIVSTSLQSRDRVSQCKSDDSCGRKVPYINRSKSNILNVKHEP